MTASRTLSGRVVVGRGRTASSYCAGCSLRLTIGEPKLSETWPGRLHNSPLSAEQVDALLAAAAEFDRVTHEAIESGQITEPPPYWAFVDWVSVDALGLVNPRHPEADGARSHNESTGFAKRPHTSHRHPFPIPMAPLSATLRKLAR